MDASTLGRSEGRQTLWPRYLAAILASILWGSLYPAGKPAIDAVGPLQVTLCRAVLACLSMGTIVVLRGDVRLFGWHVAHRKSGILGLGALSYCLSSLLAMLSLGLLPASVNGLLNNTGPLWLSIGVALFYPPRRPWALVLGSVAAVLGVGLIFFPNLPSGSAAVPASLNPLGVAISLAGSGVIAVGIVVGRRVTPGADPMTLASLASGVSVPVLLTLVLLNGGLTPIISASLHVKLLLLWVGVGCTAINYSLWFYALQMLPAARAAPFQYLIPPVGVALSAITLGDAITPALLIGGGLIIFGLFASQAAAGRIPVDVTTKYSPEMWPQRAPPND